MNYTQNYQLPQWVETDRILMEDFNDMTEKLDAALGDHAETLAEHAAILPAKGNCSIYTASYRGTDAGMPIVQLPGKPVAVLIICYIQKKIMLAVRDLMYGIIFSEEGFALSNITWYDNAFMVGDMDENRQYDLCAWLQTDE